MSSTRRIASAALAGALALALAACGSGSSVSGGSGITVASGIQTPLTEAQSGGKRGGTLTVLNQGLRTPRPGSGVLQDRLRGHLRDAACRCTPTSRTRSRTRVRTWPPAPAQISSDRQDDHDPHSPRRALQPAGQPRSDLGRRRLRDRARCQPERRATLLRAYFGSLVGAAKATGGPIAASTTPNKYDDRLPPDANRRPRSCSTRSCCR